MIVGSNILAGASGQGGYFLNRSVRLRSSASAYFNRTPATTTNQKTFTLSCWFKGLPSSVINSQIFSTPVTSAPPAGSYITFTGNLAIVNYVAGAIDTALVTTQVCRDPSAWYHLLIAVDTSQSTSTNRVKLYVNGVQVTAFSTSTYSALNANWNFNSTVAHIIGAANVIGSISQFLDGYLTEINFIDGQALTPSSFGEFNTLTGVWQPKKYVGTYGTNGFYLNFNDNSAATAAAIGKDNSGNGNNWTPNNISVTAGVTYDSMTDVPTLTSATNANFATLNPLKSAAAPTAGNLQVSSPQVYGSRATMAVSSGKWYWEVTATTTTSFSLIGVLPATIPLTVDAGFTSSSCSGYYVNGQKVLNGVNTAYGSSWTSGDVIGVALDCGANTIQFYKNNVAQGSFTLYTSFGTEIQPFVCDENNAGSVFALNFGQRPFSYTPPTGYLPLNTFNLPTPTISNGANQIAATTYTGNGAARSITNGGNNTIGITFQPDFVWLKSRSNAYNNYLYDSVRGALKEIYSDSTSTEVTATQTMTAFNSNGFSLGTDNGINQNTLTFISWQWKSSNAAAVSNTSGTISSQVSANPTAGFSIVTYTGNGVNGATVGHGLGVAPAFGIWKVRSGTIGNWVIYHQSLGATKGLNFTTGGATTSAVFFNNTAPTSTVWSLGTVTDVNRSTSTYVNYAFSEIVGYSKFGTYTGNGSTDGIFVFLGFRPRFVLFKRTDTTSNWEILDSSRNIYNSVDNGLQPNLINAETSPYSVDFLSNGFKARTTNTDINANGGTYVYAAFAENPFKLALAR